MSANARRCGGRAVLLAGESVGRVPAVRGRAVALRVEPLSNAQRLAPDGLPSLTQHGQAGDAGLGTRRPFPVPGDRRP